MGSLIRATNLWGYPELVRELGGDPGALLDRFGIPVGAEHAEDAFVSYPAVVRLIEASALDLACPDFGLRLSRWQGLDILGPVAVVARNARTVREAFEAIARYLYIHSPALRLFEVPPVGPRSGPVFAFEVDEPGLPYCPQGYELTLANGARILRMLGGEESRPRQIAFQHEQLGPWSSYEETFGCEVLFSQTWSGFDLGPELAGRPIDNADAETRRVATRYLDAQAPGSSGPGAGHLGDRVVELIRLLLPTGHCGADAVAEQLNLHPRTLQRRLADEGVRFHDLLERERKEQATRYLAEPGLYLSQIAGLLGYAEQSTFNRSCQRWFALPPGKVRAGLLG